VSEGIVPLLALEWARIVELCDPLSPAQWLAPTECPGWSVQDQVAHIVGIESLLLGMPTPPADPARTSSLHIKNEIGEINERWVEWMRSMSGAEVLAQFRSVTARRLEILNDLSDADFSVAGASPIGEVPYREYMSLRLMDCWVHEQDIRRALGQHGHLEGAIVDEAMARFVGAMPIVAGKRAGLGDGQSVEFHLTGPSGRTFTVLMTGGRAAVVESTDPPTVRLTMPAHTWCSLCLGRVDGPATRAQRVVLVDGDQDLGARVVDSLAFMI
jgi:uncharacterized protein (TIGR03083 family)